VILSSFAPLLLTPSSQILVRGFSNVSASDMWLGISLISLSMWLGLVISANL
jgi:hypothetical protein